MTEELYATTSGRVAGGGVLLLIAAVLLVGIIYASRPSDGKPDMFGFRVSIFEVARRYELSWSPRGLFPSRDSTAPFGSRVYTIAWGFLLVWLAMASIYLIIAGLASGIEVFRERRLLTAAGCASASLVLCGAWLILFRIGSLSDAELEQDEEMVDRTRKDIAKAEGPEKVDVTAVMPEFDRRKRPWLWVAAADLLIAWGLAVLAAGYASAWTYPGPQHGMLLFLAPGYGLFAGWLLVAFSLSFGVAYSAESYPDGTQPTPPVGAPPQAYPASVLPIVFCIVGALIAVIVPDPAQALPFALTLLLFCRRFPRNLIAAAVATLGVGLGAWRVYALRS